MVSFKFNLRDLYIMLRDLYVQLYKSSYLKFNFALFLPVVLLLQIENIAEIRTDIMILQMPIKAFTTRVILLQQLSVQSTYKAEIL